MKNRITLILAAIALCLSPLIWAAGTVTPSYSESTTSPQDNKVRTATFVWVSDASGNVNGTASQTINGTILRVVFDPDGGGTQPSDLYDVVLNDPSGVDVLAGQGADLSNASTTDVCPGVLFTDGTTTSVVPCTVSGPLEPQVSNAGDANGGTIIVYYR